MVFALSAVAVLLAAPLWGLATDQIGNYRPTLFAAAFVGVLAAVGLASAHAFPALLVAALALACGQAGIQGLLNARTLQELGVRRTLYGRFRLWGSAGFIGASLAAGTLASRAGSTSIFLVYVPTVVVLAVIFVLLPELPRRPQHRTPRPSALLHDPIMVGFLVGSTLEWGAVVAVNTYVSIDIANHGGADWFVGLAWSLSAMVQIPVMWMYGRLADRLGLAPLIAAGAFVYAIRPIGYVLADSAMPLVLLTSLEGLGYALFICGGVAFVASRGPRELAATAQGVFTGATIGLGAIFGSLVGGWTAGSYSIEVLFVASGLVGVLGAVIVTRAAMTGPTRSPRVGSVGVR